MSVMTGGASSKRQCQLSASEGLPSRYRSTTTAGLPVIRDAVKSDATPPQIPEDTPDLQRRALVETHLQPGEAVSAGALAGQLGAVRQLVELAHQRSPVGRGHHDG